METLTKEQRKYKNQRDIRLNRTKELLAREAKDNKRLAQWTDLDDYYIEWIDGSTLVAVLGTNPSDDTHSYYSVASKTHENIRLSPVFMYVNQEFTEDELLHGNQKKRVFVFDTEFDKLYTYVTNKNENKFEKRVSFETHKNYIAEHPVVLIFKGCDDGHVGLRFKNEADAMKYLDALVVFEDIFKNQKLQYHN